MAGLSRLSSAKAFDFVRIEMPPSKPRSAGVIEIRGPYYTPVTFAYLKGLLEDWGEYVDGYKFAGGSMRLLSRERVRQIIQLCHDYNVYVSTGGFVERVIVQGRRRLTGTWTSVRRWSMTWWKSLVAWRLSS